MPFRLSIYVFLFSDPIHLDGAPLVLTRSLERVDLCIAAWERDQAAITAFLKRY